METDNTLQPLYFVNGLTRVNEKWPSWVPTWVETAWPETLTEFLASGGSPPRLSFKGHGHNLVLSGKTIDFRHIVLGSISMFESSPLHD